MLEQQQEQRQITYCNGGIGQRTTVLQQMLH
jgi:hypothetical protein